MKHTAVDGWDKDVLLPVPAARGADDVVELKIVQVGNPWVLDIVDLAAALVTVAPVVNVAAHAGVGAPRANTILPWVYESCCAEMFVSHVAFVLSRTTGKLRRKPGGGVLSLRPNFRNYD